MNSMFNQLYLAVGVLFLLALLTPLLIQTIAVMMPFVVVGGLVIVIVRLVWFYTNRY